MEKYNRNGIFSKYIRFLFILIVLMVSATVTDNHVIIKETKSSGINITENGIFIDTMSIITKEYTNCTQMNSTEIQSYTEDDLVKPKKMLKLITRDEWIAQPPSNPLADLVLPSTHVIIAHTATEGCTTQAQCTFRVRFIQTFHIESRGWDDIGYNFLVGGDGAVYEGRGWDKQGAHTKGYNSKSICIAFIGTFKKIPPNDEQLVAAKLIIQEGVKLGKLSIDYKLYGQRQLIATENPGEALYQIIKYWSHFSSTIN